MWLKAATILGFLSIFRFHTYAKLTTKNLVVVGNDGRETNLVSGFAAEVRYHFETKKAMGFYFKFDDKFHPKSRAYYCRLMDLQKPWKLLCPVKLLTELACNGMLEREISPKNLLTAKALTLYLESLTNIQGRFTPHSLRIGGHTFYTASNMLGEFASSFGRRKVSNASELYYRALPRDNILRLRNFFKRLDSAIAKSV